MRRVLIALIILVAISCVVNAYLVDQVAISEGDIVKIVQKVNNTTTTFKVYVDSIDDNGLLHLRITKNDEYMSSPILGYGDSCKFGKIKLKYVEISGIPFLKVYCEEGVKCNITKISSNEEVTKEVKKVNVTVIPYPLIPNKKFIVMVDGINRGKIIMVDPNGWVFSRGFSQGDIIMGELPQNVGGNVVIRVLDSHGRVVDTKVIPVKLNYYEEISATIVPNKPMAGGGMVVMLSKPISGSAILIDSFTGLSNTTSVSNGIAIFRIPSEFVGPLILRVMDSSGRTVYQSIIELAKGRISTEKSLRITVSPTTINAGQKVTVRVKMNGKPCDATVYVVDDLGDIVNTVSTVNGVATFSINEEGVYRIYAKKGSIKSNEVTVKVNPKPLTIIVQTPNPRPNKPVTVKITKGAYYTIAGPGLTTPIEGTSGGIVTFTPPKAGTYTISATLNGQEKSVTVNVVETYTIKAYTKEGLLGASIIADVIDSSNGNPASGFLTVRYPDGHTYRFELVDGEAVIPVTETGNYVLMFKGSSSSIYVKSNQSILPIIALLVLVAVSGYIVVTNRFGVRDKITTVIKNRSKTDILK